jgi:hypothetical protein
MHGYESFGADVPADEVCQADACVHAPVQVYRQQVVPGPGAQGNGAPPAELLLQEPEEARFLQLGRTKDWRYVSINSNSKLSCEVSAGVRWGQQPAVDRSCSSVLGYCSRALPELSHPLYQRLGGCPTPAACMA